MKRLLIKNGMNSFSKVKQHITSRLPNVCVFIIALMLSLGLSTAQAKDRISYFHSDISGSPIAATNDNGDVLWEESYKPYGERLDNTRNANKDQNNQWFTGKQEEADLGLQYFGARWYHQASGRFISRDPAGVLAHVESNPMMFNRYAYANNNPYKYVDPDGQLPFLIPLAIFIAKEIVSEGVEQVTGLPMPTAKNGLKYAIKQANKQIAKEGMKQAAKIVKATSKSVAKGTGKSRNKPPSPLRKAEGRPHSIIEKSGKDGQYTTHNGDGTWKQYRGSGQDHGGIPRPNVKEAGKNVTPDRRTFVDKGRVRPPTPNEIPGGS
jgi:RHS repeat-associated protein